MKKLSFILLAALIIVTTACQTGGGQAAPTAISLPTAAATATQVKLNPTAEASGGQAGQEKASPVDGMFQVYIPE